MAVSTCTFDPRTYAGLPMGMFHCPVCGEMVIAGMAHTPTLTEEEEDAMGDEMADVMLRLWVERWWYQAPDDSDPFPDDDEPHQWQLGDPIIVEPSAVFEQDYGYVTSIVRCEGKVIQIGTTRHNRVGPPTRFGFVVDGDTLTPLEKPKRRRGL
jgi:hypothetical protein